jgi:iron complex transport system permease protein
LGSDLLARSIFAPLEIPVGIVTAVLGGSYLLYLLRRGQIGMKK